MRKGARIISLILITVVLLSHLFSYAYKYHNEHHECTGEDCQICLVLNTCEKTIEEFKIIPSTFEKIIISIIIFASAFIAHKAVEVVRKQDTLVSEHIEMLN